MGEPIDLLEEEGFVLFEFAGGSEGSELEDIGVVFTGGGTKCEAAVDSYFVQDFELSGIQVEVFENLKVGLGSEGDN